MVKGFQNGDEALYSNIAVPQMEEPAWLNSICNPLTNIYLRPFSKYTTFSFLYSTTVFCPYTEPSSTLQNRDNDLQFVPHQQSLAFLTVGVPPECRFDPVSAHFRSPSAASICLNWPIQAPTVTHGVLSLTGLTRESTLVIPSSFSYDKSFAVVHCGMNYVDMRRSRSHNLSNNFCYNPSTLCPRLRGCTCSHK